MKFDIQHRPAYALAVVKLEADESVIAESGAMVSMDSHVQMETITTKKKDEGLMGGLLSGLKRMVAGESFFQNKFTAAGSAGEVTFAPTMVGDIEVYELKQNSIMLTSSSYLCSSESVDVDTKFGGGQNFFSGEAMFMLKCSGSGSVCFNSFGGIKTIEVEREYIVDTGHIVAFEDTLEFKVTKFGGGIKSFIFGGEGLVCKFTGTGKLYIQTRNATAFGEAIGKLLPPREH